MMEFDFGLVGPNGQIGRALSRAFEMYGTVYELARGEERYSNLPRFRHLVNAAAFTKFNNKQDFVRYWDDNVVFALEMAELANSMGAHLHHLSSHGVAEFNSGVLTERLIAEPTTRMKPYTLSKVLAEHLVRDTAMNYTIYRCSDVVPSPDSLADEWRRNHWLSVLFAAGRDAIPDEAYPIWIADVDELARGIAFLANTGRRPFDLDTHHLLGQMYTFSELRRSANDTDIRTMQSVVDKVLKYVHIQPALATTIHAKESHAVLPEFSRLTADYWSQYAELSTASRRLPV